MKIFSKYILTCLAALAWINFDGFSQKPKENNANPGKEIQICHISNNNTTQSIIIPHSSLQAHLEHGDFIGECPPGDRPLKVFINKTDVSCNGASDGMLDADIQFSHGHPPFNILWSTGASTESIQQLQAGTYRVTVSIANGLSVSESITLNEPPPLVIDFRAKNVSCAGKGDGEIIAMPSGGTAPYSYIWSSNAGIQYGPIAKNLPHGIFRVSVLDAHGCLSIADIGIEEPLPLQAIPVFGNVQCAGGSDGFISVTPEGGSMPYVYTWTTNAATKNSGMATSLAKDLYEYTVTDANGCSYAAGVRINEPEPIKINFSIQNESCLPGSDGMASAQISGGLSPFSYHWDLNAGSQQNARAENLTQGTYHILVSDKNGCLSSGEVFIQKDKCECMLRNEDCGATMISLAQFIYCNPVAGATNYQWEFSHPSSGFVKTVQRGFALNNFHLTWVPGIQYGKSYFVRIKPFVNGSWRDYGPVCDITVPAPIPYTRLRAQDCGLSTTSLNQQLFCDFVPGAQNYQWEFSNDSTGFLKIINRGSNSISFTLGWVQGIQYGKTYDVRVRANVGGEWGNFGDVCQVSLVYPIPTTKVRYADCGINLVTMAQVVYCDVVAGATDYQWEISNASANFMVVYNRNSFGTNFQLSWITGIQYQMTYEIRVRAKVAGEWAEFGHPCNITTPNAPVEARQGTSNIELLSDREEPQLNVFPNPSKNEPIIIRLEKFENTDQEITIEVYDILGNKIYSKNMFRESGKNLLAVLNANNELPTGIYILNVHAGNNNLFDRIVVK